MVGANHEPPGAVRRVFLKQAVGFHRSAPLGTTLRLNILAAEPAEAVLGLCDTALSRNCPHVAVSELNTQGQAPHACQEGGYQRWQRYAISLRRRARGSRQWLPH